MDVFMQAIPLAATEEDVHDHLKQILHAAPFKNLWIPGYLMNFALRLHSPKIDSPGKTGILSIPDKRIAQRLIALARAQQLPPLHSTYIQMFEARNPIHPEEAKRLHEMPYQDPILLRQQAEQERALSSAVYISSLQFGWIDRDGAFSSEWRRSYSQGPHTTHPALIKFNATSRVVRIEEHGDILHEVLPRPDTYQPRHVVIRFSIVEGLSYCERNDTEPSVLFVLNSNPAFEQLPLNIRGLGSVEASQKRLRCQSMSCQRHEVIVGYTSRAVLVTFSCATDLHMALDMAIVAQLPKHSSISHAPEPRRHFTPDIIHDIEAFVTRLSWPIASKVLGLMQRCNISARELMSLKSSILQLQHKYRTNSEIAASMLEVFGQAVSKLKVKPGRDFSRRAGIAVRDCFKVAIVDTGSHHRSSRALWDDIVSAYHLDVTPTSMQLHGPYPEQV